MQTKLRQIHFTILYFFFSLTLLSIRIISQFFNLAFKILLIQVYLRSGYSPHCFVAVVLPLLVLDGFPVLDLDDLVAGCSCVNILKLLLQLYWLGFGNHKGCYVFPLIVLHPWQTFITWYLRNSTCYLFLMYRYGTSPWSLLHLYTEQGVESH